MIVAICGRHGAGKTTISKYLQKYNFTELSFAEPVKKICHIISGIDYETLLGETPKARIDREEISDTIIGKTGRQWLQLIGTLMRNHVDQDIWLKIVEKKLKDNPTKNIVITDCRYKNEYDKIKELGGKIIVVYRSESDLIISDTDRNSHVTKSRVYFSR